MAFYPKFVTNGRTPTIKDVIKHVDHIVNVAGVSSVGIGGDFIDHVADLIALTLERDFDVLYSEVREVKYPVGIEGAIKFPNLAAELLESGYSKTDIRKIVGENFLGSLRRPSPGLRGLFRFYRCQASDTFQALREFGQIFKAVLGDYHVVLYPNAEFPG